MELSDYGNPYYQEWLEGDVFLMTLVCLCVVAGLSLNWNGLPAWAFGMLLSANSWLFLWDRLGISFPQQTLPPVQSLQTQAVFYGGMAVVAAGVKACLTIFLRAVRLELHGRDY